MTLGKAVPTVCTSRSTDLPQESAMTESCLTTPDKDVRIPRPPRHRAHALCLPAAGAAIRWSTPTAKAQATVRLSLRMGPIGGNTSSITKLGWHTEGHLGVTD